jgi:hypothetical protein
MYRQNNHRPIFVLGVGAPKAGTTWLHKQISADSRASMGLIKEYHVWDAITSDVFSEYLGRATWDKDPDKQALRTKMQLDTSYYFKYFAELLSEPGIQITGDITPNYGTLTPNTLANIKHGMEKIGIQVKVVFIMRDPVERCWSSVRMNRRNANSENGLKKYRNLILGEQLHLALTYKNKRNSPVTRYDLTIQTLEEVFDPSDIYFGIFETMFSDGEIRRLSSFLGIEIPGNARQEKVNKSPKQRNLTHFLRQKIATHYECVYQYCNDRFPVTREAWTNTNA